MYIKYNIVVRSHKVCTSSFMVTVWKPFTTRESFGGDLISQAKMKRLHVKFRNFFPAFKQI